MRRAFLDFSIVLLLLALACALALGGCGQTKVTGGQSQRETVKQGGSSRAIEYEIRADGSFIRYRATAATQPSSSERVATTQATVTGDGSVKIGRANEGQLASISLDEAKKKFAGEWVAVIILLIAAAGFWLIGRRLAAVLAGSLLFLLLLWPLVFKIGVALAVCYLIYANRESFKQLVKGNDKALAALHQDDAEHARTLMATTQDEPTQRVVKSLKAPKPKRRAES